MGLTVEQMKSCSKNDLIGMVHALELIRGNYETKFNERLYLTKEQAKIAKAFTEELERDNA